MGDAERLPAVATPTGRWRVQRIVALVLARRWWFAAVAVAAVVDGISTVQFMHAVGHDAEFHPVIRLVSGWAGPLWGPVIGKVGQFVGLVGLCWFRPRWTRALCALATAVYLAAAGFNLLQLAG